MLPTASGAPLSLFLSLEVMTLVFWPSGVDELGSAVLAQARSSSQERFPEGVGWQLPFLVL